MAKSFVIIAAILGMLAVILGAFGAHALKDVLVASDLKIYQTGVQYQMVHALALLGTGILCKLTPDCRQFQCAGFAFFAGILFFSVSLYALSLSGIKILGAITPIGGVAFIVGWFCIAIGAYKTL